MLVVYAAAVCVCRMLLAICPLLRAAQVLVSAVAKVFKDYSLAPHLCLLTYAWTVSVFQKKRLDRASRQA